VDGIGVLVERAGESWDLGQEALDAGPFTLVDRLAGGDRSEHILHRVAHGWRR
jgi:hypothetical protein